MSNIKLTDVKQQMLSNIANMASVSNKNTVSSKNSTGFSQALKEADRSTSVRSDSPEQETKTQADSKANQSCGSNRRNEIRSEKNSKADPVNNSEDRKDVAGAVTDAAGKIKETLKDEFSVSDDEIDAAMEVLGLSMQDLVDPNKLNDLMMQLNNVEDSITLLTDGDLYDSMKNVSEMASELTQDIKSSFGIDDSQLEDVLEDTKLFDEAVNGKLQPDTNDFNEDVQIPFDEPADSMETEPVPVIQGQDGYTAVRPGYSDTPKENISPENITANDEQNVSDKASGQIEVTVNVDKETKAFSDNTEVKQTTDTGEATETKLSETETFTEVAKDAKADLNARNEAYGNNGRFLKMDTQVKEAAEQMSQIPQTVTTTQINSVGDIVETITSYTAGDTENIVSQLTDSIKVNISSDTTSMEMQLHPASLGAVNVQVSSVNGVVTANIIVENEAVKSALESSLISLQETFNEQGQKVEAVEVMVAGYDFNGDNGRDGGNSEGDRQGKNGFRIGGARRHINLNSDLAEDGEEEMSQEEEIARDMMERSGNTVDYTV